MKPADQLTNAELDQAAIRADELRGHVVLQMVHDFLGRFISYPCKHSQIAHALWVLHTHLMDRWDTTPRLFFGSPEPGSGKTRALEVTASLAPLSIMTVNCSPAYLFRKVADEAGRPTIFYDEIDTVFGPKAKDNEDIRGLLNAGHRKGATAGRCVMRGKTVETEDLPAYAAVAMAGLGWLPDTILSRSIVIRMRKRRPDEQVEPYRPRIHEKEGWTIKAAIESWAAGFTTNVAWPELPPEIKDRNADVWEPLVVIADAVGGDWPARARAAAVALVASAMDAEPSLGVRLLADIQTVFGNKEKMSTVELLAALNELEESPWGDIKGKPLDSRGLARRLREYNIKSRSTRPDHGDKTKTPKGYHNADFFDMWARHLPPSPAESATSATSATILDFAGENHVAGNGRVADVAPHVADRGAQEHRKTGHVSPVADVAQFQGRADRTCAQCRVEDGKTVLFHTVPPRWLHVECEPFWSGRR
jgi:hypothetical protein